MHEQIHSQWTDYCILMETIAYNTGKHKRKLQAPLQHNSKCQINIRSACDKESEKDLEFSKLRQINPID